jgi:hypothetical protein
MVGSLIGYPRNLMGLEIWLTLAVVEGCPLLASFAFTGRSAKHVYPDGLAPFLHRSFSLCWRLLFRGNGKCEVTKLRKGGFSAATTVRAKGLSSLLAGIRRALGFSRD